MLRNSDHVYNSAFEGVRVRGTSLLHFFRRYHRYNGSDSDSSVARTKMVSLDKRSPYGLVACSSTGKNLR